MWTSKSAGISVAFGQLDVPAGRQLGVGLRDDVGDDAVFDDHDGPLDDVIGREETTRGEYRSHRTEYS